jgi:hypothetical protein
MASYFSDISIVDTRVSVDTPVDVIDVSDSRFHVALVEATPRPGIDWRANYNYPADNYGEVLVRFRYRTLTSDAYGAWGEWVTIKTGISTSGLTTLNRANPVYRNGSQRLQFFTPIWIFPNGGFLNIGLRSNAGNIDGSSYDGAEMQVAARPRWYSTSNTAHTVIADAETDYSKVIKIRYTPTGSITALCLDDPSHWSVSYRTTWTHNNSTVVVSALQVDGKNLLAKPVTVSNAAGTSTIKVPLTALSGPIPNGASAKVVASFTTVDGAVLDLTAAVVASTKLCNAPVVDTLADLRGAVTFFVGDSGNNGYGMDVPITSAHAILPDGSAVLDDVILSLKTPTAHTVPPLDMPLTYIVSVGGAPDSVSQVSLDPLVVPSNCRLHFGYGRSYEHLLTLTESARPSHAPERDKALFDSAMGYPNIFYGAMRSQRIQVSGNLLWYPDGLSALHALADATQCVYREPHGDRASVSPKVKWSDAAGSIRRSVDIQMEQVADIFHQEVADDWIGFDI